MRIPPNTRLVFVGDSITDCGRARPAAEAEPEALGNGYVSLVDAMLTSSNPGQRLRIVNVGVSGDTVRDLAARWERDVFAWSPEWLSVMIGINDVWGHFASPPDLGLSISLDEYSSTLGELVRAIRPRLQGLVLVTPYYIEADRADPMRVRMDRFSEVVRGLAEEQNAILVDTQAAFDRVLAGMDATALAEDRVHPNLIGHMVLARAFLEAIGYVW